MSNNTINKVAIYSRKSRPDETEDALKRQLNTLIDLCVKNNWEFEIFQEIGSSQDINPELEKLLNKVQQFEYDAVVTTELSRLGRNDVVSAQVKQLLDNYGVKIVTPSKTYDLSSQEDVLMSDMQSIVAKQEYLNIKKRLVRGKRQSAKDGNFVGGRYPLGYEYDHKSKKLIKNEYAPIVKKIYDMYLFNGKTTQEICMQFEAEGVINPYGTKWSKVKISRILSNPIYKGVTIFGRTKTSKTSKRPNGIYRQLKVDISEHIISENSHEPIISIEDWDKVQSIKFNRLVRPPSARIGKVAFTGLIKCGLCGKVHSFQTERQTHLRITSCSTRHYKPDGTYSICENKGVKLSDFEKVFFTEFSKYVSKLEQNLDEIRNNLKDDVKNPVDEKTLLEASIKKIDMQIKKVQQGFLMDIYTDEQAQEQIKQLKVIKQQTEDKLDKLNDMSQDEQIDKMQLVINKFKSILQGNSNLDVRDINTLFLSIIDHIEYKRVGNHKPQMEVQIHFK